MKIKNDIKKGGCACGAFTYKAIGNPARVFACHCKECQKRTGSAFGIGCYFPKDNVEIIDPKSKIYSRIEQGRKLDFQFCTNCGTTVLWTLDLFPNLTAIAAGTFENTDWITPQAHVWTQSSHHWMTYPIDAVILKTGSAEAK